MARLHYHLVVTTDLRDYAFITRTKAALTRWCRHFERYPYRVQSVDTLACRGQSCTFEAAYTLN